MGVAVMTSMCGLKPFLPQRRALLHPEAVLLVHDRQSQLVEIDALLNQGVRADGDVDVALFYLLL